MTVITYSSVAGGIEEKIQVLEDPSSSGNVSEPLLESLEPGNMSDHPENQILESCGVKGRRWTKEMEDRKTEEGTAAGNVQRKRETWGRGVIKDGQREEVWIKFTTDPSGKYSREGKDPRKTGEMLSAGEINGEIKQWDKTMQKKTRVPASYCVFPLKTVPNEGRSVRMRWPQTFLWAALLVLSQCPNGASSQVRVALESHFLFLIQTLRRRD